MGGVGMAAITRFDGQRFSQDWTQVTLSPMVLTHSSRWLGTTALVEPTTPPDCTCSSKGRVLTRIPFAAELPWCRRHRRQLPTAAAISGCAPAAPASSRRRMAGSERYTTREGLPTNHPDGAFYEGRAMVVSGSTDRRATFTASTDGKA